MTGKDNRICISYDFFYNIVYTNKIDNCNSFKIRKIFQAVVLHHTAVCKQKQHPFHSQSCAAASSFCSHAASSSGFTGVVDNELSILFKSSFVSWLLGSVPSVVFEEISLGRAKEGKDGIEGSRSSNSGCLTEPSECMVTSSGPKAVAFSGKWK